MQTTKQRLFKSLRRLWPYVIFLLFAMIVIFPQIHHRIFIAGLDSYFHMNRFYEDAMQIRTGHFSYFQSLFSFRQTGRIVNAFYGPWFSYLMGLLLVITNSWLRFQVTFSVITIFLSAAFMYRLLRDNQVKKIYSLLIALIYATSFPIKVLIFKQEFTGMGAVLFPLILLLGTKMIRHRKIRVIPLALVMAVVFQIHLLSGLIGGLVLLPFAIWSLFRAEHKGAFCGAILKALGLFIILTTNLWGAILEVGTSSRMVPTFPQTNMTGPIDAITLSGSARYFLLTPIDLKVLIVILILIIVSWCWMSGMTRLVSIMSLVAFWLSSRYFPWNPTMHKFPLVANVIQFPKRFLPLVSVLALFALGLILSQLQVKHVWINRGFRLVISFGLLAVLVASFVTVRQTMSTAASRWDRPRVLNFSNLIAHRYQPKQLRYSLTSRRWGASAFVKVIPDYLPSSLTNINTRNYGDLYLRTRTQLDNTNSNYRKRVLGNDNLQLTWLNPSRKSRIFKLPMVKYGHTRIELNHDRISNRRIRITPVGAMMINSKPGKNQLKIRYQSSWWFKVLMIISVVGWLWIILQGIYKLYKQGELKERVE